MELLHLGLIIIGIIVLIIYNFYNNRLIIREDFIRLGRVGEQGVDFVDDRDRDGDVDKNDVAYLNALNYSQLESEKKYLKTQDKYFDNRLFPQVVKGGTDDIKFLKLNKEKTVLQEDVPSSKVKISDISDKIERCRIIDRTKNCANVTESGCGYCWETDKIIYGDANGPKTDVCTKKGWIPPGPQTAYYCQKKKDQELCNTMKDCGDATGERSICAWCPKTATGMPKKTSPDGKGWVPKYSDNVCVFLVHVDFLYDAASGDDQSQLQGAPEQKRAW